MTTEDIGHEVTDTEDIGHEVTYIGHEITDVPEPITDEVLIEPRETVSVSPLEQDADEETRRVSFRHDTSNELIRRKIVRSTSYPAY